MGIGVKNPNDMLMVSKLAGTDQETYIGVMVENSLKMLTQWVTAIKKAKAMMGIIKNGIEN